MKNVEVKVSGSSRSKYIMEIETEKHKLIVDGSGVEAASPVEYLLGALAACLNIVAYIVAEEQGIQINALTIDIEGNINPHVFLGIDKEGRPGYSKIEVVLRPDTNADFESLDTWLDVVKTRCPMVDNLSNPTGITFSISS